MLQAYFSRKTAYMAKRKTLKLVQGYVEEQFRQLRNYCAELKRFDVGATVVLKLIEDGEGPRKQHKCDGFKSVAVKITLWVAAKVTRIEEFQVYMAELRDIDAKA
ncbi:hypothetical protein ZIOFF_032363 [Zingiber officinale]|uniref:Uncharacterized protein n=1 Tax=Zingiber officinale TaxID=94328 RepID=A0A8J5GI75_ZINOF|nr:hypothetical protein ZIOFF_032363 [Zingiber officinale]